MNNRKILTGLIFVIAGLMVGAVFITATTYFQLGAAIFLYPLLVIFFFSAFPRKAQVIYSGGPAAVISSQVRSAEAETGSAKGETVGIADIDKRAFLKMIGGAGIALFLFSIFNKRVENLFFKKLPMPSENTLETTSSGVVDPTSTLPMHGYTISQIDDSLIAYYGFTNAEGAWFIMREDTNDGSFRYTKGIMKFPNNWSNRANLKYDYYNKVFGL